MTATSLTKTQKEKYRVAVKRAGNANKVMGWLWVISASFWSLELFFFSIGHGALVTFGSALIDLQVPLLLLILVVNIGLAVAHLLMGEYIESLATSHIRSMLIICTVAELLFCFAVLPIIPALFSLYGLYAYRKLVTEKTSLKITKRVNLKQYALRQRVACTLLVVASVIGIFGLVKIHLAAPSNTSSDGKNKYFNIVNCTTKASQTCIYRNTTAGYQVTFPATFEKSPTIFDSTRAFGPYSVFNGQASDISVSMNAYSVDVYTYRDASADTITRLQAVRNKDNAIGCGTNPTSDELTTLLNLPAIKSDITGQSSLTNAPCHFYAWTIQKDTKVYELRAINIDSKTNDVPVSAATFQTFIDSFSFLN